MEKINNILYNSISIIAHIIIFYMLLNSKKTHILTPSRIDNIEVYLVSTNEINPTKVTATTLKPNINKEIAEINIKHTQIQKEKQSNKNSIITKNKKVLLNNKSLNRKLNANILSAVNAELNKGSLKPKANNKNINGSSNTEILLNNYADLVVNEVRPHVIVPNVLEQSAYAIVKVTLLPNMKIYTITLIKSSGNKEYDNNIQQAIKMVGTFPPLPKNVNWVDFRTLYLTFRP